MVAFEVAKQTHVGMVRTNNEDSILEHRFIHRGRTYRLLAVADGMGGGPAGEVASRVAIETLQKRLEMEAWTDEKAALNAAFWDANTAVHTVGIQQTGGAGSRMGTTLVAALVDEETASAWVANVGDSRCYLLTHDGLEQVTEDHSALAEMRRMNAPRGNTARFRNVVTRAIGPEPQVIVDVFGPRQLNPGERLLLCSDGLTNMVRDSEIRGVLAHDGIESAAVRLVNRANEHGGKDNVSLVVGGLGGGAAANGARRLPLPPVVMAAVGAVVAVLVAASIVVATKLENDQASPSSAAASTATVHNPTPIDQPTVKLTMVAIENPACRLLPIGSALYCDYTVTPQDENCSGIALALDIDDLDQFVLTNSKVCSNVQPGEHLYYAWQIGETPQ